MSITFASLPLKELHDENAITDNRLTVAAGTAYASDVTVDNFARAETDTYIRANMAAFSSDVGQLMHIRAPVTPDNQIVIRQNQDKLYSGVVLDLSKPLTITLPDSAGRYQSMHVINQDHYIYVVSKSGSYKLTEESVGTRFAMINFRVFVDPNNTLP